MRVYRVPVAELFFAVALIMALIGESALLQTATISNTGIVDKTEPSGSILFKDGFEAYNQTNLNTHFGFTFNSSHTPSSWGPDIGSPYQINPTYGEVVKKGIPDAEGIVGDSSEGELSVKMVNGGATAGNNWALIFNWPGGGAWANGYTDFFVRWDTKFFNLPNTADWIILFLTGGDSVHKMEGNEVMITRAGEVKLAKLWATGHPNADSHNYLSITVNPTSILGYPISTSRWFTFEFFYKYGITDGGYRLWLDNKEIISVGGLNTTPIDRNFVTYNPATFPTYLPKGADVGIQAGERSGSSVLYIDNFLFADYPYGHGPFRTGFETTDPVDDDHLASGFTSYQIGQQLDYGLFTDGHRIVQSNVVYSGSQAFKLWGVKATVWTAETIPRGTPSTGEFVGGPYDSTTNEGLLTIANLMNDPTYGNLLDRDYLGTYHYANEWLQWDNTNQLYYATVGAAYPRSRIYKGVNHLSEVYTRIYVRLEQFSGYLQVLRTWNFVDGVGDYISQVVVRAASVSVELGATKQRLWNAYELVGAVRTAITSPITSSYTFNLNQWYCIEHRYKMSQPGVYDGGVQVWIDGNLVIDKMNLDTSESQPVDQVFTGLVTCNAEIVFYVDDFAIDTSYI